MVVGGNWGLELLLLAPWEDGTCTNRGLRGWLLAGAGPPVPLCGAAFMWGGGGAGFMFIMWLGGVPAGFMM